MSIDTVTSVSVHRHREPHVLGTLAGVVLLVLLDNGLTQLPVDSYVREVMVGCILIAAVGMSHVTKKSEVLN